MWGDTQYGAVYVFFGHAGMAGSSDIDMSTFVSGYQGNYMLKIDAPTTFGTGNYFGSSLASLGDFNQDGVDDIAIGTNCPQL